MAGKVLRSWCRSVWCMQRSCSYLAWSNQHYGVKRDSTPTRRSVSSTTLEPQQSPSKEKEEGDEVTASSSPTATDTPAADTVAEHPPQEPSGSGGGEMKETVPPELSPPHASHHEGQPQYNDPSSRLPLPPISVSLHFPSCRFRVNISSHTP